MVSVMFLCFVGRLFWGLGVYKCLAQHASQFLREVGCVFVLGASGVSLFCVCVMASVFDSAGENVVVDNDGGGEMWDERERETRVRDAGEGRAR